MANRKRKNNQRSGVTPPPAKRITNAIMDGKTPSTIVVVPTSNQYEVLGKDASEIVVQKTKKEKVPPITATGVTREQVRKAMETLQLSDYTIKPLRQGFHIYCGSVASHTKVREALKESKVGFYSHDLPDDNFYKVVLTGLHRMDPEDLRKELELLEVKPVDIKIINPKSPRYADHVNYILFFKRNTVKLQSLQQIKAVCYTVVKWEAYRRAGRGITQCSKCQRPGHGGRHCNMAPRCVYCAGEHESAKCSLYLAALGEASPSSPNSTTPVQVNVPAKCANCEGLHFASDPQCPVKKRYEENRRRSNTRNNVAQPRQHVGPRSEDFKYELPNLRQQGDRGAASRLQMDQPTTSYAQQVSGAAFPSPPPHSLSFNQNPFSIEEIMSLTSDVLSSLGDLKSAPRTEVIKVVMQVSLKYLYNDSRR